MTLLGSGRKPPVLEEGVLGEIGEALAGFRAAAEGGGREGLRVVVVQSASPKYFCVGADIAVLERLGEGTIAGWIEKGHEVCGWLEAMPVPVVAKVRGYALGGGLELALACDVILADGSGRFGLPEARLGFVPGWGGTLRLAERVGLGAARKCFYGSEQWSAEEAHRKGLVDGLAEGEGLDGLVEGFCAQVRANSGVGIRNFKRILWGRGEESRRRALEEERSASLECICHPDTKGRIRQFLDKAKEK